MMRTIFVIGCFILTLTTISQDVRAQTHSVADDVSASSNVQLEEASSTASIVEWMTEHPVWSFSMCILLVVLVASFTHASNGFDRRSL